MKEIERTNEFVEHLVDAEEMIAESTIGLNDEYPIGEAKKRVIGVEKNCKFIKIDPVEFAKNPYLQNIQIDNWRIGNIYLHNKEYYEPYKTYVYGARKRDPKTLTAQYEFCYFPTTVHFPALGTIIPYTKWMGVEVSEINTFQSFINEASGKVLLMGCGLGYVAYMLSLKENVDEVTIVELNPDIKKMFETYLKPQMNNKINIFLGDAIQFLENEDLSAYQYCSVDIWHDLIEMFPIYLKCLLLEQRHPQTKFHYWLEDDLHKAFESSWILLLKKFINGNHSEENPEFFTDVLKMQNIETIEDIRKFIAAPKRAIIQEWAFQHPKEVHNFEGLYKTLSKIQRKL